MLNEKSKNELTDIVKSAVADAMNENGGHCSIGLNKEEAAELKDFAHTWKTAKKNTVSTLVYVVIVGLFGMLILGAKAYFTQK